MSPFTSRSCHAVAVAVVGALLLSACGSDGTTADKVSLHDRLPEAVKTAGVIRVGGSFTAAPVIFKNPQGQPDGLDVDLAAAMEKVLGVRFEFEDAGPFANVLPGLFEKKYDIGMSGITDTRERQLGVDKNDKQINDGVDFVDYFMAGIGMVVSEGNPKGVAAIDDLCGRSVAVKKGTTHHDLVTRQQKACEHTGKLLKILETAADADALEAVRTGAAEVYVTDYPKAQHNATTIGGGKTFDLAGSQIQSRPFGIAVRKSDRELRDVLMKAMNALIRNGTYDELLAKRQLSAGAIQNSVVNGSQ
ncbi:polar amino acid transport system substrate-binding protein [Kitasatospora gansuensis]|uniref:Polar amino acid transport system substrate-binding protein n=1 Tax=Kitasatospora gansuensis TaxID=258050 RepID=A0A7W7WJP3_9ACTN|nr:ABC transporter substrate-binding protein [Kitasatospora gansuensis]MBB4950037.1 polar amino acid transport system substrate-binding protein [Kitasatospora gansuensis]